MTFFELKPSRLGVMQGRLSEQSPRGYQAFPWTNWHKEFEMASERGLGAIEWVLDLAAIDDNPIFAKTDLVEQLSKKSAVSVKSLCADFIMELQPFDSDSIIQVFSKLSPIIQKMGVTHVVLPMVDSTSMKFGRVGESTISSLVDELVGIAHSSGFKLSMETDLAPKEFSEFISKFPSEQVGINYDTGNSAAMGYYWKDEFDAYWDRVNLIHIKDRPKNGGSVKLGEGDANLIPVIHFAMTKEFEGPVTLQMFRDKSGVEVFDSQLSWLLGRVNESFE